MSCLNMDHNSSKHNEEEQVPVMEEKFTGDRRFAVGTGRSRGDETNKSTSAPHFPTQTLYEKHTAATAATAAVSALDEFNSSSSPVVVVHPT
ncbi:uncharacterized protein V6R79_010163 [Siganus canaliculatus]